MSDFVILNLYIMRLLFSNARPTFRYTLSLAVILPAMPYPNPIVLNPGFELDGNYLFLDWYVDRVKQADDPFLLKRDKAL